MAQDDKITQEFYCTQSGGGCGGYFIIRLRQEINWNVNIVCPKCKHIHSRNIRSGQIIEEGRGTPMEDIEPTIAAWSEKPKLTASATGTLERNAKLAKTSSDFIEESWAERFGIKK